MQAKDQKSSYAGAGSLNVSGVVEEQFSFTLTDEEIPSGLAGRASMINHKAVSQDHPRYYDEQLECQNLEINENFSQQVHDPYQMMPIVEEESPEASSRKFMPQSTEESPHTL